MEIDKEAVARAQLKGLLELMDESEITLERNGPDGFYLIGLDKLSKSKADVIVKYAHKFMDDIMIGLAKTDTVQGLAYISKKNKKRTPPVLGKGMANLAKLAKETLQRAKECDNPIKDNQTEFEATTVDSIASKPVPIDIFEAVGSFIKKQCAETWIGSPTELLQALNKEVLYETDKQLPYAPIPVAPNASSMSKKLMKLSNLLQEIGILVEFGLRTKGRGTRQIRITKNYIRNFDELMSFVKKHGIFLGQNGKTVTAEYNAMSLGDPITEILLNSLKVHKKELIKWLQSQTFKPIPWTDHVENELPTGGDLADDLPNEANKQIEELEKKQLPGFSCHGTPIQEFVITHEKLPGMNEIIDAAKKTIGKKTSRHSILTLYSVMKNKWIKLVSDAVLEAKIQPVDKVFLQLTWTEPTKRRDPDNIAAFIKFILDGMQKAGVIKNDGWSEVRGWHNEFMIGTLRSVKVRIVDATSWRSK